VARDGLLLSGKRLSSGEWSALHAELYVADGRLVNHGLCPVLGGGGDGKGGGSGSGGRDEGGTASTFEDGRRDESQSPGRARGGNADTSTIANAARHGVRSGIGVGIQSSDR